MSDLAAIRARYAHAVMVWADAAGIADPRVEAAFAMVPRENYLTPPPWRVFPPGGWTEAETADPESLYSDVLVVLDARKGINNGQPSLHAAWMSWVAPQWGESVIQVGVGAGYYTAILAELVGPNGRIDGYEIEAGLASIAAANLAGLPQVAVHAESAIGATLPAADVIYVAAGAAAPDPGWLAALREGGRLIMPWQPVPREGRTLRVTRAGGGFRVELHGEVSFVGCVGAATRPTAVPVRSFDQTRSVHLAERRPPDASATAVYELVWFGRGSLTLAHHDVAGSPHPQIIPMRP